MAEYDITLDAVLGQPTTPPGTTASNQTPALPFPLGRGCCSAPDATACHQRGLCWMEGTHPDSPGARHARLVRARAQCDDTCTTDCGTCKGHGRPTPSSNVGQVDVDRTARRLAWFTDDELRAELDRRTRSGTPC